MKFTQLKKRNAYIDMTPLIDIMFQLLLFFILSTTFRNAPSFEVNLPEASTDQINQRDNSLIITLTKDKKIVINNRSIPNEDVLNLLSEEVNNNPSIMVVIEADSSVHHGSVVGMMDLAQQAGVKILQVGAKQIEAEEK